jgi:DNA repair protein RadC
MDRLVTELSDAELLERIAGAPGRPPDESRPAERPAAASESSFAAERSAAVEEALRRMGNAPRPRGRPVLRCSADAACFIGPGLPRRTHERFYAVALDARNRPVSRHLVAVGGLSSCVVHPREVFAPLVRRRAAAAVLAHNHPSGDVRPSPEDQALTDRLVRCGDILGIAVLDHLILSRHGYFSFRDAGCIRTGGRHDEHR